MSFFRSTASRASFAAALLVVTGLSVQSCGFPDHSFISDDEFYGVGKAGGKGDGGESSLTDATVAGNGGGSGETGGAGGGSAGGATAGGSNGGAGGQGGTAGVGGDANTGGDGPGTGGADAGPTGKADGGPGKGGGTGAGGGPVDSGVTDTGPQDSAPFCSGGLDECFGVCVDFLSDSAHCGSCTHVCTGGEICKAGACASPCDPKLTNCNGLCVDIQTDVDHCGGCAKPSCPSGYLCKAGACQIDCGTFTSCIPGQCSDLATDDKHCGNCATDCTKTGQVCSGGTCRTNCTLPYTFCAGSGCVNPTNDDANCNGCGLACGPGKACIGSTCTTLVENCQNGSDDDRDGDIDCADTDCATFTCATTPAGWNGPIAVWAGAAGSGPSCANSGGYPQATLNANAGLVVPSYSCPQCTCSAGAGAYCDNLKYIFDTSTDCTNVYPWQPWTFVPNATCQAFKLLDSPPTARSALLQNPNQSYFHGTCSGSQPPVNFPATSWTTDMLGCAAAPTAGAGCGGGQCVPKPKAPFGAKLCIYRAGVVATGCPVDYPNQNPAPGQQYYQSVNDSPASGGRSCSACSCGGGCGGTIRTYTDDNCTQNQTTLGVTNATACTTVPGDPTIIGKADTRSYTFTGAGPTCGSSAPSVLSGAPQPDEPVTICCQ